MAAFSQADWIKVGILATVVAVTSYLAWQRNKPPPKDDEEVAADLAREAQQMAAQAALHRFEQSKKAQQMNDKRTQHQQQHQQQHHQQHQQHHQHHHQQHQQRHHQQGQQQPAYATIPFQRIATSPSSDVDITLKHRLTVIFTTSPVQSNPSTAMVEDVLGGFSRVRGLATCPKIIVCDGVKVGESNKFRSGCVTKEKADAYTEYIDCLATLVKSATNSFENSTLIRLEKRGGFGNAVKAALELVETPFVMVVQHDRSFMRSFPLAKVLDAMETDTSLKYVGLQTTSTLNYAHKMIVRFKINLTPRNVCGVSLIPMLVWYDSTHICSVAHYKHFVFGARQLTKGNFIEADLGQAQIKDLRTNGIASHAEYGSFLLSDMEERAVGHVDGRCYDEVQWKKTHSTNADANTSTNTNANINANANSSDA